MTKLYLKDGRGRSQLRDQLFLWWLAQPVDRAECFDAKLAERTIIPAQRPLVARAVAWARGQLL